MLGLAVLRFLVAERLATTSLCDELYEALEGFLVPREAKIRRGLDSLGEASVQAGKKAGHVARTAASQSRARRVARCAAAASASLMDCVRALPEAALRQGPRSKGARRREEAAVRTHAAGAAGRPAVASRSRPRYLDDSGDETPTPGASMARASRPTEEGPLAEKLDDKTPVKPVVPMPKGLLRRRHLVRGAASTTCRPPTPRRRSTRGGTFSGDGVSFCSFGAAAAGPIRCVTPVGDGE